VETAESGSFTQAARRFGVPASSISRRIADLEAELGAQLLVRTTRTVTLTELGAEYLQRVSSVLVDLEQSDRLVKHYQSKPTGTLKISSMVGIGDGILLPILDEFAQSYPDILLDVVLTDELTKLEKDNVDIAIRGGYAPDERIIALRLIDNDFIMVASPSYLNKYGTPRIPAELVNHKGLFFKTPNGATPWLSEINGQWDNVSGKKVVISNNGRWLKRKAVAGEGLLMLPRWALLDELGQQTLVTLDFESPVQVTQNKGLAIYMLYQKLAYANPKIKVAVDFIAARVKRDF
jgi:DNA-binding transcriptional LysR family regulator